ncbi:hypothetical protein Y1Q_0020951 [Alligator mississippiensis]|uniref:C2 domain-containing protein n=1 Tax=Alligator mississippiensis TaxID=8496 RepID=A0A151NCR5_ALLMI|nr:hypothetical protein Y1Q_0020951 [Alligator mississippiensis]
MGSSAAAGGRGWASIDPPLPGQSVVRIHLLEAEDLVAKDNFMGGLVRGKSDPYARVRLAGRAFRSRVIREQLNPRWNEVYEVIVNEVPGQDVEFDLFDKDIDKDDFLGRCKVPLSQLLRTRFMDEWLPLEDTRSGRLHMRLECLPPTPSAASLEQVLRVNNLLQTPQSEELSSALLSVFLDRAADLPVGKGSKPPSAYIKLSVRDVSYKTKRPHAETLELQVRDQGGAALGALSLPLPRVLAAEALTLDEWFPLGDTARILLRAQLGVLVSQHSGVESLSGSEVPEPEPELRLGEDGGSGPPGPELRQRVPHSDSSSEPAGAMMGQLQLTVWYHADERKLVAMVHSCRKLRSSSRDLPDPYVSLLLLPDKSRGTKRKTSVQRRTLNPEFNERVEWELPQEEVVRRTLEACVKAGGSFMSREKETLGKVQLDLAQMDLAQGKAQWYDLKDDWSS